MQLHYELHNYIMKYKYVFSHISSLTSEIHVYIFALSHPFLVSHFSVSLFSSFLFASPQDPRVAFFEAGVHRPPHICPGLWPAASLLPHPSFPSESSPAAAALTVRFELPDHSTHISRVSWASPKTLVFMLTHLFLLSGCDFLIFFFFSFWGLVVVTEGT